MAASQTMARAAFSGGAARLADLSGVAHSGETTKNPGFVTWGLTRSRLVSVWPRSHYMPYPPNLKLMPTVAI
jgi:hypothetical protein